MIFNKIRTVAKRLAQLQGKLQTYLKLARTIKRYVIQLLDIEEAIEHLERVQRSFGEIEVVDVIENDHFIVKSSFVAAQQKPQQKPVVAELTGRRLADAMGLTQSSWSCAA